MLDRLRIDRDAVPPPQKLELGRGLIAGLAAGLLVVIGGLIYLLRGDSSEEPTPVAAAVSPSNNASMPSSVPSGSSTLDASGYIVAQRQATVSSQVSGRVVEVLINEGEKVVKGQVLARLDDSAYRVDLGRAKAQLAQAQANVQAARRARENARPVFERVSKQFAGGFISAQAFDDAKSAYDTADSNLIVSQRAEEVAQSAVATAEQNLTDTIIKAPFDGVVTVKAAQAGEIVSPLSAGGGFTRTGICTIVDMDSLALEVDVAENFINRVRASQPAIVRLNAYPELDIPAKVLAIVPTADRAKATVKVRIGFRVKDPRILPEMGARVAFLDGDPVPDEPSSEALTPPEVTEMASPPQPMSREVSKETPQETKAPEAPAPVFAAIENDRPVASARPTTAGPSAAVAPPMNRETNAARRTEESSARREAAAPAPPKVADPTTPRLALATKAAPPVPSPTVAAPVAPAPVIALPRPKSLQAPDYPASEKRAGNEGVVTLELLVLENGAVGEAKIVTSSGYPKLDAAAVAVVKKSWRFFPGTEDGKATAMKIEAPIRFSLD